MENVDPNIRSNVDRNANDGEIEDSFEMSWHSSDLGESEESETEWKLEKSGFQQGEEATNVERSLLHGQIFASWEEFNLALHEYEAKSGWAFERIRRSRDEFRGRCRRWKHPDGSTCKVVLFVRCMKKTGLVTVRKGYFNHTCNLQVHKFRNGGHRTDWVARQLIGHVKVNKNASIHQLSDSLVDFYHTSSTPWTVQRARSLCREQISGGSGISFQKIPAYSDALQEVDPGVHLHWQAGEGRRFCRIYVSPSSCQHAFKFCRPLVGVDGAHIAGKFPMVLILATTYDGENHIIILAWAVVRVENTDNWTWFLEHLSHSFPEMSRSNTVFFSDRDKGLKHAVGDVFAEQCHSYCVQHIKRNIRATFDVDCMKYFLKLADARTEADFEKLMTKFQASSDRQKKFIEYVRKINPKLYARHAFQEARFGHNTSNIVEVMNGAVKPCRNMPALLLCDWLWNYEMERHYAASEHSKKLGSGQHDLTQYANNMLKRLLKDSRSVKERTSSPTQALMIDKEGTWVVRVQDKHCDCGEWKEMDFPCKHAIRFMCNKNIEVKVYVGTYWLASNQKKVYEIPIPPLAIDHLAIAEDCYEPLFDAEERKKGKSAKRKASWNEAQARLNDRIVKSQSHRCSKCKQPGHNARRCISFPTHGADEARASHQNLRVGSIHSTIRETQEHAWQIQQTRPESISFMTWIAEGSGSQTGPSQLTQL